MDMKQLLGLGLIAAGGTSAVLAPLADPWLAAWIGGLVAGMGVGLFAWAR
jgi:hypothetical protein